jgi:hypothetical protein
MTDQELRALVRDAIARSGMGDAGRTPGPAPGAPSPRVTSHTSHALFTLTPGDPDGRCMIEPGVPCNHCGYCKSYGH